MPRKYRRNDHIIACGWVDSNEFIYFMVREVTMAKELAKLIEGLLTTFLVWLAVVVFIVYVLAQVVKSVFF